jgi:quinol monooxygenase YgiN
MIVVRFKVKCQPEKSKQLRAAFEAVVGPSRTVEGVLNFDIARDLTDPECSSLRKCLRIVQRSSGRSRCRR